MKLFPNEPINIYLYGRVVKKLPHNNVTLNPPSQRSYINHQGKEIIISIDDFYTVDEEKIYRPQNVRHNYKLNDLYNFAKSELESYLYSGIKGFKNNALDFYNTYKERNGKLKIDFLEEENNN